MLYDVSFLMQVQESPKINPNELEQIDVLEKNEHRIILFNDDVNTFEHVINCLVKKYDHNNNQTY